MWVLSSIERVVKSLESKIESQYHQPWVESHGCCGVEIENVQSSTYDWRRLGVNSDINQPDLADVLIVAGWITKKRAEHLKTVYSRLSGLRSVIAVGACTLSGSPYKFGVDKVISASDILPVDIFVPGCPPRPEALLEAIRKLQHIRKPQEYNRNAIYEALKKSPRG